ncbi:type I restriction enzyme S subunit [Pedobacter sp. UYEF25]
MMDKELPEEWKWVRLGDVCAFVGGGTPRKNQKSYWNGNLPWASVKDVKGEYLKSTKDFISEIGLKNSSANVAEPYDVILITRISPGKTIITNIRTAINQDLKVVRPKFKTSSKFLSYYFQAFEREIVKKSSGTTVLGITLNNLNEIKIPLLDFPTQQAIVSKIEELFSELDKGVENLKTAQQQLKVHRQAVLKWAFEGKLTKCVERDANDLSNEQDLAMVAEPEGVYQTGKKKGNQNAGEEDLPEGWKYKRLGDMFNFVGGGTPSKSEFSYWNGNINWASVKDVKGDYLIKTQDYITEIGLRNSASNLAQIGDVILITRISPGKAIISKIITSINQDLKIAKPRFETTSGFVKYFFNSLERQCIKAASGTTVLGITLNNLNELLIPDLSLGEQTQIVEEIERRLSVADKMEESIQQSLLQAESLRQSILKKAFEGKLMSHL